MSDCDKYTELASRMIDGELDEREQEELRAHISACEDCRRVYEAFSAMSSAMSEGLEEPPEGLARGVMFKIGLERGKGSGRRFAFGKFTALAACLAVIVFAASKVGIPGLSDRTSAVEAPMAMAEDKGAEPESAIVSDNSGGVMAESEVRINKNQIVAPAAVSGEDLRTEDNKYLSSGSKEETEFEAESFNVQLFGMTEAEIFLQDKDGAETPLLAVTEEDALRFLAEMLTVTEMEKAEAPNAEPTCVVGVTSGEQYYTVTVWIVDGRIWGRDDKTGMIYLAAGEIDDLIEFISQA